MTDIDDFLSDIKEDEYGGLNDLDEREEAPENFPGDELILQEDESSVKDESIAEQPPDNPDTEAAIRSSSGKEPIPAGSASDHSPESTIYTVRGTQPWNTEPPYVMDISAEALEQEREQLNRSFFFIEEPLGETELGERIKNAMISFVRKKTDILETYSDFVNRTIISETENLASFFETGDGKNLFLYHCGPVTIFNILQAVFMETGIGYCYVSMPDMKARRFMPREFLKHLVLNWFEENINTLQEDFDSMTLFRSIRQKIQNRYLEQRKKFNQALEMLNGKLGGERYISPAELMKKKGGVWFSPSQKCVYRRFLGSLSIDH